MREASALSELKGALVCLSVWGLSAYPFTQLFQGAHGPFNPGYGGNSLSSE